MINKSSFRFYEIDGLRMLAALSVVLYYYLYYYGSKRVMGIKFTGLTDWVLNLSKYGFLRVELFFAISGFVILYSANNKARYDFLRGRVLRIFPMLWLKSSLTFVVCVCFLFCRIVSGFSSGIPKDVILSLGGITYPFYLLHQEIGYSILQYSPNGLPYMYNASLLSAVMVLISFLYRYCEPPIKNLFNIVIERAGSRNKTILGV